MPIGFGGGGGSLEARMAFVKVERSAMEITIASMTLVACFIASFPTVVESVKGIIVVKR